MTAKPSNVFLVGPMGAGKTTIGRRLAQELGLAFHDSDRVIEERTGADIPLIFDLEGEEGFRRRERAIIDELSGLDGIVLATGGGAILDPDNRRHLRERGRVIYLHASVPQQLKRTAHDSKRPLLQTSDPHERLAALFHIRDPLYRETAHLVIDTDGKNVHQVVRQIVRALKH